MLHTLWFNFTHNLLKPLLLFFYMGFRITLFKVALEYHKAMYQGLTIYLLISIGWHGGEELDSPQTNSSGWGKHRELSQENVR